MPEHTPTSHSSVMDVMALRSVTELPVTRRHVLDPEVLRMVAAVDRVGDLTRFNVAEVPSWHRSPTPKSFWRPTSTAGLWGTRCPWPLSTGSACG